METQIAIIGGGLSGLFLAHRLVEAGCDMQLFEARSVLGGRIRTVRHAGAGFDLGPSWFWPGQPRMAALVQQLGLEVFDQHASGDLSYEDETGRLQRGQGFASMEGSWRLKGGMAGLISGLAGALPPETVHTGMVAEQIAQDGTIRFNGGQSCTAQKLVLALPPRIAAGLTYQPALGIPAQQALEQIPTWMGGHAKFIAVYDHAFWRRDGLSGDAMSRHGPMAEIHDASAPDGTPGALFGFLGVAPPRRKGAAADIAEAALSQLGRLFGAEALSPVQTYYQDWAFEPHTASGLDQAPLLHHPEYGLPRALRSLWDGRLYFCSTEMATEMGGYLEGALAAAEMTARQLIEERAE